MSEVRFVPDGLGELVLDVRDEPHYKACGKFWRVRIPIWVLQQALEDVLQGKVYRFPYESQTKEEEKKP